MEHPGPLDRERTARIIRGRGRRRPAAGGGGDGGGAPLPAGQNLPELAATELRGSVFHSERTGGKRRSRRVRPGGKRGRGSGQRGGPRRCHGRLLEAHG